MTDRQTLDVYAERAGDYARRFAREEPGQHLRAFSEALPEGGRVLDLGCGPGSALTYFMEAGFAAEGLDASPEFAALARERSGAPVRIASFDDLDAEGVYDGVYANFSLLHAPKSDMPKHLEQIARALKPGGVFHIGLKTGTGETRDALGRFYAFYSDEELTELLTGAGFEVLSRSFGKEAGLAGTVDPWIVLLARKSP